jgi:histidinol dehydrogenase
MTALIRRLDSAQADFDQQLEQLLAWDSVSDNQVAATVDEILTQVKARGDAAVLEYTNRFDRRSVQSMQELEVSAEQLQAALQQIGSEARAALEAAAGRIRDYHQRQRQDSWQYTEANGTVLGQQISALERVGLYVPGGKASYPSSVLMNAIPAKVAGVEHLTMVVPAPDGQLSPMVLAAAAIAGVDRVLTIGGAQAVAALAYGTQSIVQVDKIVGPGNIYVATAKRAVFGQVAIDMIAGPSEILVICDGQTNPDWIAMDLFSQAEHDEQAQSIFLCADAEQLDRVEAALERLLPTLERHAVAGVSLRNRGALIKVANLEEAVALSNRIAPEHLELAVANPEATRVRSLWDATRRRPWVIIVLAPITCCLPREPRAFHRRWVCMISRSAALLSSARLKVPRRWARLLQYWLVASRLRLTPALRNIAFSINIHAQTKKPTVWSAFLFALAFRCWLSARPRRLT